MRMEFVATRTERGQNKACVEGECGGGYWIFRKWLPSP